MSDPPARKRPGFGRVFGKAVSSLGSLGVAGAAAVAAAALGSWPILAIGGAAYGALVAWDLASPDFWKRALGDASLESVKLPDPQRLKDPTLAAAVRRILGARGEVARVLDETPASVKDNLYIAVAQIAELESHTAKLVARGEDLFGYLAKADVTAARAGLDELGEKIRKARSPDARAQYEAARRAREEQVKALEDLDTARDRIAAQLATIVAALEGLPPKIMRMRTVDAEAMDQLGGDVNDELKRMNGEVAIFEETLRSMQEVELK